MKVEIKVWLEDIEKAISEINDFLPEPRNFLDFEKDIKTKSNDSAQKVSTNREKQEKFLT